MSFAVHTEAYQGPLQKLLELVEEKKLPISALSLAEVTGDFLKYFESLRQAQGIKDFESLRQAQGIKDIESLRPRGALLRGWQAQGVKEHEDDLKMIIADFLIIASRLLLIKSKALLPSLELEDEEEESIRDLETRLLLYQELKGAKRNILQLWRVKPRMVGREFLMTKEPVFYPPASITSAELLSATARILGELEKTLLPVQKIRNEVINLKEKIEEMLRRISFNPTSLHSFHDKKTKSELVVLFLAVLHLVKDSVASVNQDEVFGSIFVAKKASHDVE